MVRAAVGNWKFIVAGVSSIVGLITIGCFWLWHLKNKSRKEAELQESNRDMAERMIRRGGI